VNETARNSLINLEDMSDIDVESMKAAFAAIASNRNIRSCFGAVCRRRFDCPALAHLIGGPGVRILLPPPDSLQTFGPTGFSRADRLLKIAEPSS